MAFGHLPDAYTFTVSKKRKFTRNDERKSAKGYGVGPTGRRTTTRCFRSRGGVGWVNVDGNIIPDRGAWHMGTRGRHLIFILHTRRGSQPKVPSLSNESFHTSRIVK